MRWESHWACACNPILSGLLGIPQAVAQGVDSEFELVREVELGKNRSEVIANCGFRNSELLGDFLAVAAVADKSHNFPFARSERLDLVGVGILLLSRKIARETPHHSRHQRSPEPPFPAVDGFYGVQKSLRRLLFHHHATRSRCNCRQMSLSVVDRGKNQYAARPKLLDEI